MFDSSVLVEMKVCVFEPILNYDAVQKKESNKLDRYE